jgi:4-hydroxyphenylacetate 3-monooxygenase oxygenase component
MGLKTGKAYIESLRDDRDLYVNGERVGDVTKHAPYSGILDELAAHFDRFHDPEIQSRMTFPSPKDGAPVSNSFLFANTWDKMLQRIDGESLRKELTYGMMGRLPDFMNAFVTDVASIPHVLGHKDKSLADNAIRYWEYCRDEDICLTHTLVDPKRDYSKGLESQRALKFIKETDAGIIVSGARMLSTLAPVSEEIWVGPYIPRQEDEEDYALSFAVPVATPGLSFVAREPYSSGRSRYDRPLSERFDEGDALALFDNVLVPWDRVFVFRDVPVYNTMGPRFPGYLTLQAVIRGRAKLRFMIGLASKMLEVLGRDQQLHFRSMLGEMLACDELADGLITASGREVLSNVEYEAARAENPQKDVKDDLKEMAALFTEPDRGMVAMSALRFFIPFVNKKAAEIVRLAGSSSLVMTPTEADFDNPKTGPMLEEYIAGAGVSAKERVQVMKLAWDAVATQFGGRQDTYETFFGGDPEIGRQLYYMTPKRQQYMDMIDRLMAESTAADAAGKS